jgi:hypothetical protein
MSMYHLWLEPSQALAHSVNCFGAKSWTFPERGYGGAGGLRQSGQGTGLAKAVYMRLVTSNYLLMNQIDNQSFQSADLEIFDNLKDSHVRLI